MRTGSMFHVLAMISLAVGAFGCNFAAALPTPTPVPPTSTTAPSVDARQAVIDAITKLEGAYPYRLTATESALICPQQLETIDFAGQDQWHAKWSGCLSGEAIAAGGTTYYLNNGSWTTTGQALPGTDQLAGLAELMKPAIKNVASAGSTSLNGLNTNVYTFDVEDPMLSIKGGKVWIGTADGLPHQVQASFSLSGISVDATLVFEFGVPVTVQAPVP